jgi:hypothetical protein
MMPQSGKPFWQCKTLDQMSDKEWEQLCDRCGLCCLVRLEGEDTGQVHPTRIVCSQYDCDNNCCRSYSDRSAVVEGCTQLTPKLVREFNWLPDSCAYRLLDAGKPLPDTHPLLSNSYQTTPTLVANFEPVKLVVNAPGLDPQNYLVDDTL